MVNAVLIFLWKIWSCLSKNCTLLAFLPQLLKSTSAQPVC